MSMLPVHSAVAKVIVICLTLLGVSPAHSAGTAPEPALPPIDDISRLTDADLGFSFLAAGENLATGIGVIHQAMKDSRDEGQELAVGKITDVVGMPDGSTKTNIFDNFEELDRYVTKIRRFHTASKAEIMKRGFKTIGPSYTIVVAPGCPKEWLASGTVETEGIEFYFQLHQQPKVFEGVFVRSAAVVIFPGGFHPPMAGKIKAGKIRLSANSGECAIVLTPAS